MGRKSLADARRSEIIAAFYQCVVKEGFAGASIRKVAKEAGVQPSVLHHYFADRDEMIEEMVTVYADIILQHFKDDMGACKDADEQFQYAIHYLFSESMINDDFTGFFLECLVESRRNPKVRETIATTFRRFRKEITDFINGLEVFKQLPANTKKAYTSMIIAMHEGTELQWFANPKDISLEDAYDTGRLLIELLADHVAVTGKKSKPESQPPTLKKEK